jgi:hypothetical protein
MTVGKMLGAGSGVLSGKVLLWDGGTKDGLADKVGDMITR